MRTLFLNSYVSIPDTQLESGAMFTIALLETKATVQDVYFNPGQPIMFFSDSEGKLPTFTIPTPTYGSWKWSLKTPDGVDHIAYIGQSDGSPIEISDWFALSEYLPDSEEAFLSSLHNVVLSANEKDLLQIGGNNYVTAKPYVEANIIQKTYIEMGLSLLIPKSYQMIVYEELTLEENSELVIEGELIIL